jgi:predicted ATP-grasp superfamily ATP-dependent carboligase
MADDHKPTVLVIEANGKAALPIIESMGHAGIRVLCGAAIRYNSGFYSRFCRERYVYPSPKDCSDDFKQWLINFVRRKRVDMVFPVGHYGAFCVSEVQDVLCQHTRLVIPPHDTFLEAYAKIPTMRTAIAADVPIPESWFPGDHPGGLEEAVSQIKSWPALIKPSIGVGARGITWCHSEKEILERFPEIESEHGESYLQDFVPPGGMQYKVDMLTDRDQGVMAGVVYGKTRMYPPDGGSSVLNFSADRPDILEYARRMLVQLKWVGICDFDFVEDPRDGTVRLMEINPRFPESFRMGTSVGIDFPKMLYDMGLGKRVEPLQGYPANRFLRFLVGDLMWFLRVDNRRRFGTWPNWFDFWDRNTAYQVISLKDIGPFMGYVLENTLVLLDSKARKARLRMDSGPGNRS